MADEVLRRSSLLLLRLMRVLFEAALTGGHGRALDQILGGLDRSLWSDLYVYGVRAVQDDFPVFGRDLSRLIVKLVVSHEGKNAVVPPSFRCPLFRPVSPTSAG